jgi:hypothetical protein
MDYLQGERKEEETVCILCVVCVCACLRSKGERRDSGNFVRRTQAILNPESPGSTIWGTHTRTQFPQRKYNDEGITSSTQERNCLEVQHVCLVITFG